MNKEMNNQEFSNQERMERALFELKVAMANLNDVYTRMVDDHELTLETRQEMTKRMYRIWDNIGSLKRAVEKAPEQVSVEANELAMA